jgi:hypothetical protein
MFLVSRGCRISVEFHGRHSDRTLLIFASLWYGKTSTSNRTSRLFITSVTNGTGRTAVLDAAWLSRFPIHLHFICHCHPNCSAMFGWLWLLLSHRLFLVLLRWSCQAAFCSVVKSTLLMSSRSGRVIIFEVFCLPTSTTSAYISAIYSCLVCCDNL